MCNIHGAELSTNTDADQFCNFFSILLFMNGKNKQNLRDNFVLVTIILYEIFINFDTYCM